MEPNPMIGPDAAAKLNPLVLTTGHFSPGEAASFCAGQPDEIRRRIGEAELLYYRGEIREASERFQALSDSEAFSGSIASLLCRSICALADGNVHTLLDNYRSVKLLRGILPQDDPLRSMTEYYLLYVNILIHNVPDIHFPQFGIDAFSVPDALKPMAFYAYAHYLMEIGDIGRAIGMAEGALILSGRDYPIAEIDLCLLISTGYMLRAAWDKAEYYFRHAWEKAKPDGLLMPFAEHRRMLFGMLEKCLRYEEPAAYKRIQELAVSYHKHWVFVHNELTGDTITDSLTSIEYNVAKLAKNGMANQEIADFLGITVNSVRAHLRHIFNKLGIESRKELSFHVI